MSIKVLVVDDSGFFRRRVTDIINADGRMEVVGVASNGMEAIEMNDSLKPDVITMDYEMPVMDGITAVRNIMQRRPVPVLMFSSLTFEGARVTLDALDAGALDFLPKNFDQIAKDAIQIKRALTDKIAAVAKVQNKTVTRTVSKPVVKGQLKNTELVVIGTSTGGPAALQTLFKKIPGSFKTPIVIVQHMPGSFTKAFAERLNTLSPLVVKEAVDGDRIEAGHVYVAPGGMQLMVDKRGGGVIHIRESDERVNYRPSVDIAFASAAKHYGARALGIVLTGMGADGREGARLLKETGATVWAQDEDSCVIFGMPFAVIKEGLSDEVLSLNDIGPRLVEEVN
ncbi:protein-glutamate methylesterase/protein-glutamine glutaminase [Thalassolituus marinus]|uniref:Protein-glutamate methylesterase/protein-glutamine glutaminase n=1 Tax=Thalassolituus marinus TaxID=671053 RepID=A0ABS7ZM54_9GAMM|nr:chemotaxis response regulator protein-glutamate methylesterase [Thalassolituus marinus]MCA6062802.1 chemotaxis response regulator protein-glutamate methylesterase [Thalassolituus marinus]